MCAAYYSCNSVSPSFQNKRNYCGENPVCTWIVFTPKPIYNPCYREHFSPPFFFFSFFFPEPRAVHEIFSPLRASSSLVICVATKADSRLGNYSVHKCLSRVLSLSLALFLSLPPLTSLPPNLRSSFFNTEHVILRSAGETSCSIPRLRPPTRARVSGNFFLRAARVIG